MKKYLLLIKACLIIVPCLMKAQCVESSLSQLPEYTVDILDTGYPYDVNLFATTGYYTKVHLHQDVPYTFISDVNTDYLTLTNPEGTEVLGYGVVPYSFTSNQDMDIRIYVHADADCNSDEILHRLRVIGGEPAPLEDCIEQVYTSGGSSFTFGNYVNPAFDVTSPADAALTLSKIDLNIIDEDGDFTTYLLVREDSDNSPGEIVDTIALNVDSFEDTTIIS